MKFNTTVIVILFAFGLSLTGFILSILSPQHDISDLLMIAGLFSTASSSILSKIFTKPFKQSKNWKYMVIGALLILMSMSVKYFDFIFLHQILLVTGSAIVIFASGIYFYLRSNDFKDNKWIWFTPFVLLGYLFKYMRWYGANIIILTCLLIISVLYLVQFIRQKKHSLVKILLLLWILTMCACIGVFTLRYVSSDYFVIGSVFTWLALIEILLQHELDPPIYVGY